MPRRRVRSDAHWGPARKTKSLDVKRASKFAARPPHNVTCNSIYNFIPGPCALARIHPSSAKFVVVRNLSIQSSQPAQNPESGPFLGAPPTHFQRRSNDFACPPIEEIPVLHPRPLSPSLSLQFIPKQLVFVSHLSGFHLSRASGPGRYIQAVVRIIDYSRDPFRALTCRSDFRATPLAVACVSARYYARRRRIIRERERGFIESFSSFSAPELCSLSLSFFGLAKEITLSGLLSFVFDHARSDWPGAMFD